MWGDPHLEDANHARYKLESAHSQVDEATADNIAEKQTIDRLESFVEQHNGVW